MSTPKLKFLIDAGHGGMTVDKGYVTPGKRSPLGNQGIIYEGASNRAFAYDLAYRLALAGRAVEVISDGTADTGLGTRVKRANEKPGSQNDYLLLSIHSNASTGVVFGQHGGLELFTSVGETRSDLYAEIIGAKLKAAFPELRWRHGKAGSMGKEHDWTVVKGTSCPAILLEVLFMDGQGDYYRLTNPEWRSTFITKLTEILIDL